MASMRPVRTSSQARQAVALLRQARVEDEANYEIAWKLARSDYYVADHTTVDQERDESFREGIEAGLAAVKLRDRRTRGSFLVGSKLRWQRQEQHAPRLLQRGRRSPRDGRRDQA